MPIRQIAIQAFLSTRFCILHRLHRASLQYHFTYHFLINLMSSYI